MLTLITMLLIKHQLFDFIYQTPYMYLNKGNWKHPGGYVHAGLHALATALILYLFFKSFVWLIVILAAAEFIIHYVTDYVKVNINKVNGYTANDSKFWIIVGYDQLIHNLTYVGVVFFATKFA